MATLATIIITVFYLDSRVRYNYNKMRFITLQIQLPQPFYQVYHDMVKGGIKLKSKGLYTGTSGLAESKISLHNYILSKICPILPILGID